MISLVSRLTFSISEIILPYKEKNQLKLFFIIVLYLMILFFKYNLILYYPLFRLILIQIDTSILISLSILIY